jgi:hypothetical protein
MSLSERTQNSEVLESFVAYARQRPELRFWQALLNWSGVKGSICIIEDTDAYDKPKITDTYSWISKNGR